MKLVGECAVLGLSIVGEDFYRIMSAVAHSGVHGISRIMLSVAGVLQASSQVGKRL
jgi:hypothetical protein